MTSGILLVIYLTLNMIIGENGLLKYMKLKALSSKMQSQNLVLKEPTADEIHPIDERQKYLSRSVKAAREYGLL